MQVQLESTDRTMRLSGVECRIWEGHTASGIPVHAFIARVCVGEDQDASQFEAELRKCRPLSEELIAAYGVSTRLVL
jgi:hypothetical protein